MRRRVISRIRSKTDGSGVLNDPRRIANSDASWVGRRTACAAPETPPVLTLEDASEQPDAPVDCLAERAKPPAPVARRIDYLERDSRNSSLARARELLVVSFERKRLLQAGQARPADRVEHTSIAIDDGPGYDVRSFEADGRDRYIEVKTTAYGKSTPFFVIPE